MNKKLTITFITSIIVFIASVAGIGVLYLIRNNQKHTLSIECQRGGYIELVINDEKSLVEENTAEESSAKRADKITLTAKNFEHFTFDSWFKNGKSISTEAEIEINVTENVKYFASFNEITYNLLVSNGSEVPVTYTYGSSENLLIALKREFAPAAGYTHKYFIGENEITAATEISADSEIIIKKELINYTISFTHNDNVVETRNFTVEDYEEVLKQNLPNLPAADKGYTLSWATFTINAADLKNITVKTIKTPIEYTATFVYGDKTLGTDTFTVEDQELSCPEIPAELFEDGYECKWSEFVFNYRNETIQLVKSLVNYTLTFKHKDTVIKEVVYTILNATDYANYYPNLPKASKGYTIAWEEYTLLQSTEVNTVETPIEFEIIFIHEGNPICTKTFTIENYNDLVYPDIPSTSVETGKEYRWDNFNWDEFGWNDTILLGSVYDYINYSLSFYTNGGVHDFETTTYTMADSLTIPQPTKEGYKFIGWTGTDLSEKTVDLVIEAGSIGNRTYTANWELISAKVKLGTLTNIAKVYYGTDVNNISTELTTEGFVANSETEYFFRAELIESAGLTVVSFSNWSGAFESETQTTEGQTFNAISEDHVYEINAEAVTTELVRFELAYEGITGFKDLHWNGALLYANNGFYKYENSAILLMDIDEFINTYFEVVDSDNDTFCIDSIKYNNTTKDISSKEDLKTKLLEILNNGESTRIEFYYY